MPTSSSPLPPNPTAPLPPPPEAVQEAANQLRTVGWIGVWTQGIIAVVGAVTLLAAVLSRGIDSETQTAVTGLALLLGTIAIIIAAISTFFQFRFTRLGRRLRHPDPLQHPTKSDTLQLIKTLAMISLVGVAIAWMGSAIGTSVLLAKSFSQPQGAAVYTPDKVVRVLDILVVLVNVIVIGANLVGTVSTLWLTHRLKQV